MKKKFLVGTIVGLMSIPMTVNAQGVSTIKFEGNNNINVGDEFNVNMVIDNIKDTDKGIVAFGGYINYDKNVLELINTSQADNNYEVLINKSINKIAALDFTLTNGIKERTNVYTLTFKAINEGNTSITLTNGEVDDINGEVNFNVEELNVNANKVIIEESNAIINTDTNEDTNINNSTNIDTKTISTEETNVIENIENDNNENKENKKVVINKKITTKNKKQNILKKLLSFISNILKK